MERMPDGFDGFVDDCWVERWHPDVAQRHGGEDECFAALRVTFTMSREQAIAILGEDNLPHLPVMESAVVSDDMPAHGQRWRLVRVMDKMIPLNEMGEGEGRR